MTARWPVLLVAMGVLLPLEAARGAVLRHALVIGVNDGGGTLEPLKYAEQDAKRFADLLTELGDFDPEQISVLYSPNRQTILAALDLHNAIAAQNKEDLFILYYSGHADARGLRLGEEVFRYEELREEVRLMPAEVRVGVLDACRAGAIVRLKGARLTAPFLTEDDLMAEGEAWITAASADELAQESDQIRGSFFTHYLVSGLRGAADNGDGVVSLDEAYRYAFDRTVARTGGTEGGTQHPVYDFRLQGAGELPLTDVRRGLSRVTLPPEIAGEIAVLRLPDRVPVAEVAKPKGESVNLALAPGRYLFRLRTEGGIQEVSVGLSEGAWTTLSRFGPERAPEVAQLKGVTSLTSGLGNLALHSSERIREVDWRHNPWIAGAGSAVIPGSGQFYNGQWFKGGAYFVATATLLGGGLLWRGPSIDASSGSLTGPNFMTLLGAGVYGLSIADAAWQAGSQEDFRPRTGLLVSTETAWRLGGDDVLQSDPGLGGHVVVDEDAVWPDATGFAVDWVLKPGFSMGLDRTGVVTHLDGTHTFNIGGRMMLGVDRGKHVRPGLFIGVGLRAGPDGDGGTLVRPVASAGANLRYYLTPRYYFQVDARQEVDGGDTAFLAGGGLGVHFLR